MKKGMPKKDEMPMKKEMKPGMKPGEHMMPGGGKMHGEMHPAYSPPKKKK